MVTNPVYDVSKKKLHFVCKPGLMYFKNVPWPNSLSIIFYLDFIDFEAYQTEMLYTLTTLHKCSFQKGFLLQEIPTQTKSGQSLIFENIYTI